MENYDDCVMALERMAVRPDYPKLKEMLALMSGMLDALVLSIGAKELNGNTGPSPEDDRILSFFGSADMLENKEKSEFLVKKIKELVAKQSFVYN